MKPGKLLIFFAAVAFGAVAPIIAKSGTSPKTQGPYEVVFKGVYEGAGTAAVSSKKVSHIKGAVTDTNTGASGQFDVKQMPLSDDGHFEGTGEFIDTAGNMVPVIIAGRVEVPDANATTIKKSRILCTYTIDSINAAGRTGAGRVVGSR